MKRTILLFSYAAMTALAFGSAAADDPSLPAAPPAPEVTVRPIDGGAATGRLASLDEQSLTLQISNGDTRTWSIHELRSLDFGIRPPSMEETPPVVVLANDDVLSASIIAADEDTLTLHWTTLNPPQPVTVPLETVRSFAFQQPQDEQDRIRLRRIWALAAPNQDRLISTDNSQIDGQFLGVANGRVQIETSLGQVTPPVDEAIAVLMNSELVSRPNPEGTYRLVSFRDGSRISFSQLRLDDDGQVTGRMVAGSEVSFPLEQIIRVQFLGDRVIALADLTPADYQFTPYLTQQYPVVANRNVQGGRLRLRGETYATGLGVSSKSEVTYDIVGRGYERFEAVVGIDDMTGGQGNVIFAVEVDGRRVYESNPLSGHDPAEAVGPIDVVGGEKLTLVVEFGQHGNIQDVANWCDAALIRPGRPTISE